jgi:hypothetical protein
MKPAILSRGSGIHSTRRPLEAALSRGHEVLAATASFKAGTTFSALAGSSRAGIWCRRGSGGAGGRRSISCRKPAPSSI